MSSPPSKKRAASPADNTMTLKRMRGNTPSEREEQVAASKETGNATVSMQSAAEDFFSKHYDRSHGNVSPRLPSEMTGEQQLATAVAQFRPLPGPVPSGFDVESLPVYRAPVSHKVAGWTVINAPAATPATAPEEVEAANEPEVAGVDDPATVAPTPADQICQWSGCSKIFPGFNGPTLLWLHLTNEHVQRPIVEPDCKWANCAYSNKVRKNLLSHVGNHVPEYLPIGCEDCGKGFKQQSHLTRHQKEACPNRE